MQKKQVSLVRMALSLILSCKGFGKHFIADEDEGCGHGLFAGLSSASRGPAGNRAP